MSATAKEKYSPTCSVGIYIGNTTSTISICSNTLPYQCKYYTMPSNIYLLQENIIDTSTNHLHNVKKHITDHTTANANIYHLEDPHYQIDSDAQGNLHVHYSQKYKQYSPKELIAAIISKLHKIVFDFHQFTIKEAIITAPAYFGDTQRQLLKDACQTAGITVLRVINEPTAALIATEISKQSKLQCAIILHIGGQTSSITLINIEDGVYELVAEQHDSAGGKMFDDRIIQYCLSFIMDEYKINVSLNTETRETLRRSCEKAKCQLTESEACEIIINYEKTNCKIPFSRAKLEEISKDLVDNYVTGINKIIVTNHLTVSQINHIVLTGGSTKIPYIRRLINEYYGVDTITCSEHIVSKGAAIQASIISGYTGIPENLIVDEMSPIDYGIETAGGIFLRFIQQGMFIPATITRILTTNSDYQESVQIKLYQGYRPLVKYNTLLETFVFQGIPIAPKGIPQIKISIGYGLDYVLHVTVISQETMKQSKYSFEQCSKMLSYNEIVALINEKEVHSEEDKQATMHIESQIGAKHYLMLTRKLLALESISSTEKEEIQNVLDNILPLQNGKDESNFKKISDACMQLLAKHYNEEQIRFTGKYI